MSARLRSIPTERKIGVLSVACCWLLLLAGCPNPDSPQDDRFGGVTLKDVRLTLLVIDDPALAAAIRQVEGEWNAQTGSDFQVEEMSTEELASAQRLGADAVIGPSCQLGGLAERAGVVPVPKNLLEDDHGHWSEVFSLLRVRETVWGKRVVGVPFGSPVFTVYYRPDLLEKLGCQPPQTWAEYRNLAKLLSERDKLADAGPRDDGPWYGAIEPLGPGWAAVVLLARAAPYATHRENYSTLFNIETMEPLIDGPPFVRALEELVAVAAAGPPELLTYDPAAVRAAFWQGQCGLALSWPTAAKGPAPDGEGIPVGLAELPGAAEAYDIGEQRWEPRRDDEDPHVPLLGTSGRMGLVVGNSKWPDAAFQLLFWLSDGQSTQVCPLSPATTLFRSAHVESPQTWVEKQIPAAIAAEYAEMTEQTLCRPQWLFPVRIPGRLTYLAALDEAVHRAVRGEKTPEESLRQAAAAWQEITEQAGRESQREAYWNSLGLE